jgi:hypothetical protein
MVVQRNLLLSRIVSVTKRIHPPQRARGLILLLTAGCIVAALFLTTVSVRSEQNPSAAKNAEPVPNSAANEQASFTTPRPTAEPKKSNIEKTQDDAAALSALADKLRDELNKMNANVFSLDVIQKTEEVEKLARKIKGEASKRSD